MDVLRELVRDADQELPRTLTVRTPSSGVHIEGAIESGLTVSRKVSAALKSSRAKAGATGGAGGLLVAVGVVAGLAELLRAEMPAAPVPMTH